MSSIVERLTEGVVNRDMRAEGSALLSKWERTGLLEGLDSDRQKNSMARLLENQAKELLRETSTLGAGDVEGFAAVAFPIVRRVFAGLIANDLVSVQPMSLPSGLIFFLDFVYSPNLGGASDASTRLGNTVNKSIYGTDQVGSQVTGGVDLVGATNKENLSGPRVAAGYSYSSPTGSNDTAVAAGAATLVIARSFALDGAVSEENKKLIQYDPDLLSITDSSVSVAVVDIAVTSIADDEGDLDLDNMAAFEVDTTALAGIHSNITDIDAQIRRLTTIADDDANRAASGLVSQLTSNAKALRVVGVGTTITAASTATTATSTIAAAKVTFPLKDQIDASSNAVGAVVGDLFALENNERIPEIDIKVDSIAVTAQTKKLKAKWTPELGQDLNAYHNLDAEVELTSILSEQIALEIDREILNDLVKGATAEVLYWSRRPGKFVNRQTGKDLTAAGSAGPDFTGNVSEWYETLVETINDVSAQIHRKTLRGGANFIVVSPEIANLLEFTSGFRANVTLDSDKGTVGAVKVGALSKKWDVYVDPYFLRNVVLVGRKGGSFLESGYVYAPYVPLQVTPTIFGTEDFVPRKGVMTRYAKKMVRPDMYGLVVCTDLLG